MPARLTVEGLIAAGALLSHEDRQRLILALTRQATGQRRRITELKGLGKEVWQGRDAQDYVNAERDSWGA